MANKHSITDFIKAFAGGSRTNRFRITGTIGDGTIMGDKGGTFLIRATTLPASQVGGIPVNYRGRTVIYPGDRAYAPWQIAVLDDPKGHNLYKSFHNWSNQINKHADNSTTQTNPSKHFSGEGGGALWTVEHLETDASRVLRTFKLHNCWPAVVGPIELDMGQDNLLATFPVTIVYSHYEITHST